MNNNRFKPYAIYVQGDILMGTVLATSAKEALKFARFQWGKGLTARRAK